MRSEIKEMPIAGYNDDALSGLSTSNKHVIRRIILNDRFPGPGFDLHGFEIGEDLVGQKKTDLIFRQAELGIGQDPQIFFNDLLGNQRLDLSALPEMDKPGWLPPEQKGRYRDVRVNDNGLYFDLAHLIASATQSGFSPNFFILDRICSKSVS